MSATLRTRPGTSTSRHTHSVSAGSRPGAGSAGSSLPPERRSGGRRERLIDAALELSARQGYDATTADQIAAKAGVSDADFAAFFGSTEAVLMSIVEDMAHATAAALKTTPRGVGPERALLSATAVSLTAIVEGRGAVPLDRLLAMARIVNSTRNLAPDRCSGPQASNRSTARRLDESRSGEPASPARTDDVGRRHRQYVRQCLEHAEGYTSQGGIRLRQRMIAYLSESFADVMGVDPSRPE